MSRLTGNEVRGLMEAYQAVYAPQELTEEQVWEEVEEWVNALVEEGYDLSDYTWEEMYESYITEAIPLAIPAAAPYILPALGAAAGVAKGLMNRGKAKNTPEEERFLNTGSFAARVTSSDARDKKPAQTKRETPTERRQRIKAAADRRKAANPKPEVSNTPVSGRTIRNPVSPSQLSASNRPGAASSSGSGGSQKPPGFGEKFRRKLEDARAKKEAAKEARRAKPNPIGQAVSDTAADLTARGVNKLATLGKIGAWTGAGLGAAQLATDGLVGKVARDAYNLTRQAGPAYDRFMGRGKGTTPPPPSQPERRRLLPGLEKNSYDLPIENIITEGPDWNSATKPKGVAALTLGSETKVFIPGQGWQFPKTARRWARAQGYENWDKIPNPPQPAKPVKPAPDQGQGSRRSGESLVDFARRQSAELQKDFPTTSSTTPATPPASQPPASQPPTSQPPATTTRTPASTTPPASTRPATTTRTPASTRPAASSQTGDRTKDLTTWASANKVMINKVGTPQQKEILSAADKGTAMPAHRPISKDIEDIKRMQADSRSRQGVKESYDAYDLVLEYLLSQGHAGTLEEANYVMLEMDAEMIGDIVDIFYK